MIGKACDVEKSKVITVIKSNKSVFYDKVERALNAHDHVKKVQLCSQAAIFAVSYPSGVFNSKELEEALCAVASHYSVTLSQSYEPNSFLHIMTRSYSSGGHTRVCERWIKTAPANQKHSIALTGQGDRPIPSYLKSVVADKSGDFISLDSSLPIDRALRLRELASKYEYVILHVHMYDVVPLLAFGTPEFERPVVLYNHADHLFWLGCSIADIVVNFRTLSQEMDKKFRGIKSSFVLPLPILEAKKDLSKDHDSAALKKELGFAQDSKIMVTIASSYKYKPFNELDFIETVKCILEKDDKVVLLAIGPSIKDKRWRQAYSDTLGRINPIGIVPHEDLLKYISLSDLALESFPLGSPTGLLDIAKYNVHCVSMWSPANLIDTIVTAGNVCRTPKEYTCCALKLLNEYDEVETPLSKLIKVEHYPEAFSFKIKKLISLLPKHHVVSDVLQDDRDTPSDFEIFIAQNNMIEHSGLKGWAHCFVRKLIYWYVLYVYPKGMTPKLYDFLVCRGLL